MTDRPATLRSIVRRFRILRNWKVRWAKGGRHYARVYINPKRRLAFVYPWPKGGDPEPADFRLHEVLHVALRALTIMDRRSPKELLCAEEELVQDLCGFLNPK